jgi:tetratricopeptide (TPR) repeat protein
MLLPNRPPTSPRVTRSARLSNARILFVVSILLTTSCDDQAPPTPNPSHQVAIPTVNLSNAQTRVIQKIEHAVQTVEADPSQSKSWGELGIVYLAHGFKDAAETCLARAGQLDPKDYRWPHLRSYAIRADAYDQIVRALQDAINRRPDFAPARIRLAFAHLDAGDHARAKEQFNAALAIAPRSIDAHIGLARIAFHDADFNTAMNHLSAVRRIHPNSKETYELLSQVYRRTGRVDDASRASQRALSLPARSPSAADPLVRLFQNQAVDASSLARRGSALVNRKQFDEGLSLLHQAVAQSPETAAIHRALGAALTTAGRYEQAIQSIEEALDLSPDRPRILIDLGAAYAQKGDPQTARDIFERILKIDPLDVAAWNNLASMQARLGHPADALASFNRCVELNPGDHRLYRNLAMLHLILGDQAESIRQHEKCVRYEPYDVSTRVSLAHLYLSQNMSEKAVSTIRAGLELMPDNPRLTSELADLNPTPRAENDANTPPDPTP